MRNTERKTKGKLIVIDGSDASGKKTQAELLLGRLRKEGAAAKKLSFPQYNSFFGRLVSDYLNGRFGKLEELHPVFPSILYALDRLGQREKLLGWLKKGYVVVLDRYVESNLAYQSARISGKAEQRRFVKWIEKLEYGHFKLPRADCVVFLHVPISFSQKLIRSRQLKAYLNGKERDIHERNLAYLKRVQDNYLGLAKRKNWVKVECVKNNKLLPKREVHELIWRRIRKLL